MGRTGEKLRAGRVSLPRLPTPLTLPCFYIVTKPLPGMSFQGGPDFASVVSINLYAPWTQPRLFKLIPAVTVIP